MPSRISRSIAPAFLAAALCAAPLDAETAAEPASEEALVEEILALRQRLDELWSRLSPAARERLREKLAGEAPGEEVDAPPPSVPPPPAPAVAPPPPAPQPAAPRRPPRRRPRCELLLPFDSNGDDRLSALDRAWRHVYLWVDRDGDGELDEDEVASAYDRGVREIALDLDSFADKKGHRGDVRRGELVVLDVRGDGFDGPAGRRADDGVLAFDAGALARGGLEILSPAGEPLSGLEPLRPGWRVRDATGGVAVLDCPDGSRP